ncbi:hypothetical protein M513_01236 [Trichuris suis]|uniref:HECT-type E3 ubiquitin transferase n=1 Tax=Trichuris suis TaxID=68888 RepID=A0A085MLA7_9BILA|nr:hypothetical protein M513_01236 [Trichuris suis]
MQNNNSASCRPSLAAFCFGRNNLTAARRTGGISGCFINKQNRFLRLAHGERDERRQYHCIKEAAIRIQALWRGIMARRQLGEAYRMELEHRLNQDAAANLSLNELRLLVWKFSVYYECPRDTSHLVLIVSLMQQNVEEIVNDFRWSIPVAKLIHALITCIASLSEAPAVLPLVKKFVETKRSGCILRLLRAGMFETLRTYVEQVFTVMTKEMRCESENFNQCIDCIGISLLAAESFETEEDRSFVYKQFFIEFFCKKSQRIISDSLLPILATKWKVALLKALCHAQAKASVYTALSLLECIRKLQADDSLLLLRWHEDINKLLCVSLPSLFDIFYYRFDLPESSSVRLPRLDSRSEDMDEPMLDTLIFLLNDKSVVEYLAACFKMAKNDGCSRQYGVDLVVLFYKISSYGRERPKKITPGACVAEEWADEDGDKSSLDKSKCMQLVNSLADDVSLVPFFWLNAVDSAHFDLSGIVIPSDPEEREICLIAFGSTCVLLSRMLAIHFDSDFVSPNVAISGKNPSPLAASDLVAFVRVLCRIAQTMIYDSCSTSYGFPSVGSEAALAGRIRPSCLRHAAQWDDIFVHIVNVLWNLKQRDDRMHFCQSNDWTDCDCRVSEISAQKAISYPSDGRLYAHTLKLDIVVGMNKIRDGYFVSLRNETILSHIPFAVSFEERVWILRSFIQKDREIMGIGDMWIDGVDIKVRRSHMFQDAYAQLKYIPSELFKGPIRVMMYNSASVPEAGIDGGGIFREFISEVLKQGFSPDYGFFLCTQDESELYPNPTSEPFFGHSQEVHYFFGRLVGKAIYEGLQVEPRLALFYLAAVLYYDAKSVDFNYLSSYNRTIYNSLRSVVNYDGDVEDLQLDFSIMAKLYGILTTFELIPGGANVKVNNQNRREYVRKVAEFFQITLTSENIIAFRRGLTELINFEWLSMFSPAELQILISGFSRSINVDEWQSSTLYEDTPPWHPVVKSFWKIVQEMTELEKSRLLRFVTSCSRPPLLGFASFQPLFTIRVMVDVTDRLPTSATCVNLLKLPNIPDALTLKEKLLFAIQSSSGFELC